MFHVCNKTHGMPFFFWWCVFPFWTIFTCPESVFMHLTYKYFPNPFYIKPIMLSTVSGTEPSLQNLQVFRLKNKRNNSTSRRLSFQPSLLTCFPMFTSSNVSSRHFPEEGCRGKYSLWSDQSRMTVSPLQ